MLTVVAFGFMIFVHELGHFLAAKLIGVRVDCFSFGFGWKLVSRKWRGTEYCISAVPLGGYVKLAGGDEGEEATGAPDEFVSKPPGQRFLVFVAGPLFSVLFGIPLAMAMLVVGRYTPEAKVSTVIIGSPAWDAGVHYADRVKALGSRPVATFEDLRQAIHETPFDESLDLLVERGGKTLTLRATRPKGSLLGVDCRFAYPIIHQVEEGTPAAASDIRKGDTVLAVNNRPVRGWFDFRRYILANPGRPVELTLGRNGQRLTLRVTPRPVDAPDPGFTVRIPPEIGYVRKGFPAEGRLRVGDIIRSVNATPVACWWEVEDAVSNGPPVATFVVDRPAEAAAFVPHSNDPQEIIRALQAAWGTSHTETLTVELARGEGALVVDTLGIAPKPCYEIATIHRQTEPPVQPGDRIVKVGRTWLSPAIVEQELYSPLDDVLSRIGNVRNDVAITVKRRAAPVAARPQLTLTGFAWAIGPAETHLAVKAAPGTRQVGQLGVSPTPADVLYKESLLGSIGPAIERTISMCGFVFTIIAKLFQRDVSIGELMGPLGIVQVTYQSATRGWSDLFWLIHLITVNIGVFNILPIPPLDGGRMAMLAYEKLRGRRPSRKVQEAIILAGFSLVVLLFLIATWNDFARLLY